MVSYKPLTVLALLWCSLASAQTFKYRWVYCSQNLQVDSQVQAVKDIIKRAHAAGYNGIVLADYKLQILDLLGENTKHYLQNLDAIKRFAADSEIDIYPCLPGPGYASAILAHNPNLAEGPPVKDALFVTRGKTAGFAPSAPVGFKNGDFEQATGDKMEGWEYQDEPGIVTFADPAFSHSGHQAVRVEHMDSNPQSPNARLVQSVNLVPWHLYHVSTWVKTSSFSAVGNTRVAVLTKDGKDIAFSSPSIQPTQDWTRIDVVFNSLGNTMARVYFGTWGGGPGKLWWDDCAIEEVGAVNLVRRTSCPLAVTSEDGTQTFEEGKDFERFVDPQMGNVPWPGSYNIVHAGPELKLTPGSRIKDGHRLHLSYNTAAVILQDQLASSMIDPEYFDITAKLAGLIHQYLNPKGYFAGHDEIRVEGWDKLDATMTPGQALADNFRKVHSAIRNVDPNATVFVWSDMFDPFHNAVKDYYLVNGSLEGSWKGLSSDVVIVNWNSGKPDKSLPWFQSLGNPQILAGYYDSDPHSIKSWLAAGRGKAKIVGVMYTTWANKYGDLEIFAKAAWGGG